MRKMGQSSRFHCWARMVMGGVLAASALVAGAAENLVQFSNGESITKRDLSAYLDRRIDLRSVVRNHWGVETVLQEMALTRALVLEGERLGEPRVSGRPQEERFDDVYAHAIQKKLSPACQPLQDETAVRKFFDENPRAFRVPPTARLSRVILPTTEVLDGAPAMNWLLTQAQAIASGQKTFDEVAEHAAASYKLDPQGDLGWVTLTDEAGVLSAIASARAGDMVGPVREGEFGYLFSVIARRDGRQLTWDEAKVSAATRAMAFCRDEAVKRLRTDMFEKYGVQLDQASIRGLFLVPSRALSQASESK